MFGFKSKDKKKTIESKEEVELEKKNFTEKIINAFKPSKKEISYSKEDDLVVIYSKNFEDRAASINKYLCEFKKTPNKNYLIKADTVKFNNGEGKVKLVNSVRGKDVYIITDVSNYSITYNMFGFENHMSPDDHFMDLLRTVSAIGGKAKKITVIMPLLYSSRQHRRQGRESLDCAMALKHLEDIGVSNVITFDAHDANIQNVTPYTSFDTIFPVYPILKEFIQDNKKIINRDNLVIISPDNGAMGRCITYASLLGLDIGMFYKRRDYTKIVNGKNPILEHSYTGPDVSGKSVLIVDDMIASGESMVDVINELKLKGAKDAYVVATFAFFTEGLEKFNQIYEDKIIKRVYTTNASYISDEMKKANWLKIVKLDKFISLIIDTLHKNESLSPLISSTSKIKTLLEDKLLND